MEWKKIWKNKGKILNGIFRYYFPNEYVERVAAKRATICNQCVLFDKHGMHAGCYVSGKPCCTSCHCNMSWKWRNLSSECGIKELFPDAELLWTAEISEEKQKRFEAKTGYVNEH